MNYILQTNSLTKKYKNFQALNGLTMNVPKGSIYGFVGKNGAGKTTLIRLICGLQEPTSGSFSLYGIRNDSKDIIKSRRRMGAVVETPSIYMDSFAYFSNIIAFNSNWQHFKSESKVLVSNNHSNYICAICVYIL